MQEEITKEKVHITEIVALEFRADGSFAPKTLPVDLRLLKAEPGKPHKKSFLHVSGLCSVGKGGFERLVDFGSGDPGTMIFRNPTSGEFAASVWDTELFYFYNLLALMEFFRRYGEFFRAVSESDSAGSLRGISSALREKEKR